MSEARLVLKDAGFLVSMSGEYSSAVPLGYVISATDRTNGTVVKDGAVQTFKGATIAVVLSQGKSQ
jgi:beta-lactam-binding protein with PASTA domain